MTYKLKAERVEDIFQRCLLREGESTAESIVCTPYVRSMRAEFSVARLEYKRGEVRRMLALLHSRLQSRKGGQFGLAYYTQRQAMWTTDPQHITELLLLGNALGLVRFEKTKFVVLATRSDHQG